MGSLVLTECKDQVQEPKPVALQGVQLHACVRDRSEEVRHVSRIADSACPFLYWSQCKKGHAESAFRDASHTSSGDRSRKGGGRLF